MRRKGSERSKETSMVLRPKGSDRNKAIAAGIATIAVRYSESSESGNDFVYCHGPCSVYSFFAAVLPLCARDTKEVSANPEGVSRIEMSKILVKGGYQIYRKRELVPGSKDQVKRGCRRWKYRRWMNPGVPGELEEIDVNLRTLCSEFPEISSLSLEVFCQQLSLFRSGSSGSDLQCESTDEEESPERSCRMIPGSELQLAFPASNRLDANLSSFKCFEATNQDPGLSAGSHRTHARFGPVASEHDDSAPDSFLNETFLTNMFQLFSIDQDTAGRLRHACQAN